MIYVASLGFTLPLITLPYQNIHHNTPSSKHFTVVQFSSYDVVSGSLSAFQDNCDIETIERFLSPGGVIILSELKNEYR